MRGSHLLAVLAATLAAVGLALDWVGGPALAVLAVFVLGIAWGWAAALVVTVILVALPVLIGEVGSLAVWALYALALLLAAGMGLEIGARLRKIELRQRRLRSNMRAVMRAAQRATRFQDPEELIARVPRLFEQGLARATCVIEFVGDEIRVVSGGCNPLLWTEAAREALREEQPVYQEEGPGRAVLVVPMCGGRLFVLEAAGPLDEDERALVNAFVSVVCLVRQKLVESREAEQFSRLMTALASSHSLMEASEKVIQLLIPILRASSGIVAIFRQGRFELLAMAGKIPPEEEALLLSGLPAGWGAIWRSYIQRSPLFIEDYGRFDLRVEEVYQAGIRSLVFVPVSGERRARIVLVMQDERVRTWSEEDRNVLALVARGLGLMAEQFLVRERMDALLRLEREVLGSFIDEAYETLMRYAVRLVPGAEAGSLLVRTDDGRFVYAAALGYDLESLRKVSFSLEDVRDAWYNAGEEKWSQGEPRIVSAVGQDIAKMSHKTAPVEVIDQAGRVREIKANLCLPIVYQGGVLAVMNLDAFSDPEAFDDESVEAARIFAQQTALLLHEQHYRKLLERAAHTDPLTGLPNRRAFDEDFGSLWESAQRYGYPLALLVMDLSGFKQINDRFGHAAGDRVLQDVAKILSTHTRHGDRVYRWGGDEFALLLPHTALAGAVRAARRYAAAIERVCLEDHCVHASIGAASFPEDAQKPEELLKLADSRMYQAKAAGLVVEPRG
ncbi:diguanylate cyclase [Oceanithermus sp.]